MGLGGYKYKGYSVQKSDYNDDQAWALAIHKCRVKAFVDSANESGSAWECCRTQGDTSLDSNGYIYDINYNDPNVNNVGYATYFGYDALGNDSYTAYYLILTLPSYQICLSPGDSSSNNGKINVYVNNMLQTYNSSNHSEFYCKGATCFYALSIDDFGNHPNELNFLPANSTRLIPCGGLCKVTNTNDTDPFDPLYNTSNFIDTSTAVSFGVCTKQGSPDIIDFCKDGNAGGFTWHTNITSPSAISKNIDETDLNTLASVKLYSANVDSGSGEIDTPSALCLAPFTQCLDKQGNLFWGCYSTAENSPTTYIGYNSLPRGSVNDSRMYGSLYIDATNGPKGFINPELTSFSWQNCNHGDTVSNGKYLCIATKSVSQPLFSLLSDTIYVYVGWHKDNPDMKSAAAAEYITFTSPVP